MTLARLCEHGEIKTHSYPVYQGGFDTYQWCPGGTVLPLDAELDGEVRSVEIHRMLAETYRQGVADGKATLLSPDSLVIVKEECEWPQWAIRAVAAAMADAAVLDTVDALAKLESGILDALAAAQPGSET